MSNIKHQVTATIFATALALTFASGCGADVEDAPGDIGVVEKTPAPPDSGPTLVPSVDSAPCVFSAQAAQRLDRPVCVH